MPKSVHGVTEREIEIAKQMFLEQGIPLPALSSLSQKLIGKHIPVDVLKHASRDDPDGSWATQRRLLTEGTQDVTDEIQHLRQIMYQQIVLQSNAGLFLSGEFDEEEVKRRLRGIPGLEIKRWGGRVDSNLINTYMNILAKSNIEIRLSGANGKTPREQVLDAIRMASGVNNAG